MDDLRRATLHEAKSRSQNFMSIDQIAQTLLIDLNIERADDAIIVHVCKCARSSGRRQWYQIAS